MRIRRKFLQLTKWTYPYGTEFTLESYLPKGVKKDENENYYIIVGDNPTTMFACHLDTACSKQEKVTHVQDEKFIRTNGTTILGADDKAGMTVVLYMIEKKIPGIYYFFLGEEVGCIGSGELADEWANLQMFDNIKKIISFDRRGTDSVITHQLYGRCCSDEFAEELSKRLNDTGVGLKMAPDSTGIMTDSAKFVELVPECTNISVGYYREHTFDEHQDIEFLQKLCKAVVKVDWETLPVKRDPKEIDNDYGWGYNYGGYSAAESDYDFVENNYTYVKYGKEVKRMLVSKDRVAEEKLLIHNWASAQESFNVEFIGVVWNGHSLWIESSKSKLEFIGNRTDIMEFIPELKTIPVKHLSERPRKKSKVKEETIDDAKYQREFLM